MMDKIETFGGFTQTTSTTLSRVVDKITLTTAKHFNFPSAMYRKNKLSRYKAARLFYNKKDRLIGIEFIPTTEEGAFKLIPSGEDAKYGAYIVAKSFFFLNNLRAPHKAQRYDYRTVGLKKLGAARPGTMFVIDLNKKEEPMAKNVTKK
jgi:hypothetical protein